MKFNPLLHQNSARLAGKKLKLMLDMNPLSCCPNLYNLLSVSIRAEHIFSRFETALKTFVRQRKFYTFEEYSDYLRNL